ncbi:hypothetical protein AUK57_00740 [Candidatus Saccharibacteria bacterium CG2_30_41_52]|nr:MAG: hypothetical protein AUK57_00740 [Candidatus Saccharibacteria bacterium CG2_30_41_52]
MDKENLSVVRQSLANASFSHKVHEVASDRKTEASVRFKYIDICIISLIFILLVLQTQMSSNFIFSFIGAGLTAAEIVVLIVKLFFHFDEDSVAHKNTALKYMALRDRYKNLIADIIKQTINQSEIVNRRDQLLHEYQMISDLAPQTSKDDYCEAMKRLKIKEDNQNIWSDTQVDHFLPKELRKK